MPVPLLSWPLPLEGCFCMLRGLRSIREVWQNDFDGGSLEGKRCRVKANQDASVRVWRWETVCSRGLWDICFGKTPGGCLLHILPSHLSFTCISNPQRESCSLLKTFGPQRMHSQGFTAEENKQNLALPFAVRAY